MRTRPERRPIRALDEQVVNREEVSAPIGTTVSARDPFYNVPAHLKLLKTVPTELGHIVETVQILTQRAGLSSTDIPVRAEAQETTRSLGVSVDEPGVALESPPSVEEVGR